MSCNPELVTGYVDDALDAAARAGIESHLAECTVCREQVEAERRLHEEIGKLPSPEPRRGFERDLRRAIERARPSRLRILVPLAAVVVLAAFWTLRLPRVVAWEIARDHQNCFSHGSLPAEVWGDDGEPVVSWLEAHGSPMPPLPAKVNGLNLVGARRCPIADRKVVHVYYTGDDRKASLFVIPGSVNLSSGRYQGSARREAVRIFHVAGATVGVVAEDADDAAAFERSYRSTLARAQTNDAGLTLVAGLR